MSIRGRLTLGVVCGVVMAACISCTEFVNSELLTALAGQAVRTLPSEAPGLLVSVENRTEHLASVAISYRGSGQDVKSYTLTLEAQQHSAQLLVCPVTEITLGNVTNLAQSGAWVVLQDVQTVPLLDQAGAPVGVPFIEVEPFAVLLRESVNYECGDELQFLVEPSGATRSGFGTEVLIRRSGVQSQ